MGERGVLAASRNQTIRTLREIHEGCKQRHSNQMSRRGGHPLGVVCACCGSSWPCPDYVDAVAALAILDNADREDEAGTPSALGTYAVIPDPGVDAEHTDA